MTQHRDFIIEFERDVLNRLGHIEARIAVLESHWKIVRAVLIGVGGLLGLNLAV